MRIEFETEGGLAYFPGLSKPVAVDSSDLPEAQAAELERLVRAVGFSALPPTVGTLSKGAADYQQYTVTVEEGGQRHTVRFTDPVDDPNHRALIDTLRTLAKTR